MKSFLCRADDILTYMIIHLESLEVIGSQNLFILCLRQESPWLPQSDQFTGDDSLDSKTLDFLQAWHEMHWVTFKVRSAQMLHLTLSLSRKPERILEGKRLIIFDIQAYSSHPDRLAKSNSLIGKASLCAWPSTRSGALTWSDWVWCGLEWSQHQVKWMRVAWHIMTCRHWSLTDVKSVKSNAFYMRFTFLSPFLLCDILIALYIISYCTWKSWNLCGWGTSLEMLHTALSWGYVKRVGQLSADLAQRGIYTIADLHQAHGK